LRSMTGFGRGHAAFNDIEVTVEARSVNHRFLDMSVRLPRAYSGYEADIRKTISNKVNRGKVEISVTRSGGQSTVMNVAVDHQLAQNYHKSLLELRDSLGIEGNIALSDMLTLKDIIVPLENTEEIRKEQAVLMESVRKAVRSLDEMRTAEGAAMWKDMEERLDAIRHHADLILPLVDQVTAAAKERLDSRVEELTGGIKLDPDRLLQEVALFAEKSDVTEEITRLYSHLDQFISFADEGSPIGRKLDFLLQELHREINTIASKSASTDISKYVVNIKAEIEKIREQTQNLE
jgi:uncharacterized protein (TIGR00255 family)